MNFLCALYNDAVSHRTATQCRLQPIGYGFRQQQETCLFSETSTSDVFLWGEAAGGHQYPSRRVKVLSIYPSKTEGTDTLNFIHSTVQSRSGAANRFAATQEIPHISRNPKVHYRTHKHPPPVYPGPAQSSPYTHIPPPGDPF